MLCTRSGVKKALESLLGHLDSWRNKQKQTILFAPLLAVKHWNGKFLNFLEFKRRRKTTRKRRKTPQKRRKPPKFSLGMFFVDCFQKKLRLHFAEVDGFQ